MKLTSLIKRLGSVEPDGHPFLSLYLNTEANETGREDYRTWLKKAFSEQTAKYETEAPEKEKMNAAAERINEYLDTDADVDANGIAIFASLGDSSFFEAAQIDVAFPENLFFNLDRPHIFPLARAVWQNPRYAVLWVDTNKADIYIFGGEDRIRTDNAANDKVEQIKNRVTNRTQVGGFSQARYQRHIDNFHLQHAKEVVAELEKLMSKRGIDHLVLCGDETTIMPILKPQLSKAVEDKVVATINMSQYDSAEEIEETTREAMGIDNATGDHAQVKRVLDAANAAAGMGSLGLEDTLRALSNGQVQKLVVSADLEAIEYDEKEVQRILNQYAPGDDNSGREAMPKANIAGEIADLLIVKAINTDAKIEFIEDASLLEQAGGVGAVFRYNMNTSAATEANR